MYESALWRSSCGPLPLHRGVSVQRCPTKIHIWMMKWSPSVRGWVNECVYVPSQLYKNHTLRVVSGWSSFPLLSPHLILSSNMLQNYGCLALHHILAHIRRLIIIAWSLSFWIYISVCWNLQVKHLNCVPDSAQYAYIYPNIASYVGDKLDASLESEHINEFTTRDAHTLGQVVRIGNGLCQNIECEQKRSPTI